MSAYISHHQYTFELLRSENNYGCGHRRYDEPHEPEHQQFSLPRTQGGRPALARSAHVWDGARPGPIFAWQVVIAMVR